MVDRPNCGHFQRDNRAPRHLNGYSNRAVIEPAVSNGRRAEARAHHIAQAPSRVERSHFILLHHNRLLRSDISEL
jgi:hypothetical protein